MITRRIKVKIKIILLQNSLKTKNGCKSKMHTTLINSPNSCYPISKNSNLYHANEVLTFLAMIRPVGLCNTLVTTPPLPAPSSPSFSKSSSRSSPTFCFWDRNSSNRSLCWSSISSSFSFCCSASKLAWAPFCRLSKII